MKKRMLNIKKGMKKLNLISLSIATSVVLIVFFLGMAQAIVVSLSANRVVYENNIVTFTVRINIETGEAIPVQNLTLVINESDTSFSKECVFLPNGTFLTATDCNNLEITPTISSSSYRNISGMYGVGYGYQNASLTSTPNSYNTSYYNGDYSYGYGAVAGVTNEISYKISWNASADNKTNGSYSINLRAYVSDGQGHSFIYTSQEAIGFSIGEATQSDITITSSTFTFTNPAVREAISSLRSMPVGAKLNATVYGNSTPTGWSSLSTTVFNYFEININQSTTGGSYTIYFNIPSTMLGSTPASDIRLYVYESSGWSALTTTVINSNTDPVQFSALTTHFSRFAVGKVISSSAVSSTSGGSRMSGCILKWDCSEWSKCSPEGKQTRTCNNIGTCPDGLSPPETVRECEYISPELEISKIKKAHNETKMKKPTREALFDINVELMSEKITRDELLAAITLINFGQPGLTDVSLHYSIYSIEDTTGNVIYEETEIIPVETQKEFVKIFDVSELDDGEYILSLDLKYEGQTEPARAEKKFVISKAVSKSVSLLRLIPVLTGIVVCLGIVLLLSVVISQRRSRLETNILKEIKERTIEEKEIDKKLKKIKQKKIKEKKTD